MGISRGPAHRPRRHVRLRSARSLHRSRAAGRRQRAAPPSDRVGLLRDVGVATPRSAVNDALDTAAGWLTEAGYVVEEVELPLLEEAYRLWYLLAMEEFPQIMPLVEEIGDEGMKRAATTYYAAAEG